MLQMERKASDNKYLHKDFHVTLDLGITYIGGTFRRRRCRQRISDDVRKSLLPENDASRA